MTGRWWGLLLVSAALGAAIGGTVLEGQKPEPWAGVLN
jgi:hypothetical protein